MNQISPLKKIVFALLVIVLLPALFFSVREFSSLNENEEFLSEIYRQQLETILFSINQYSWDVVNSWASQLNALFNESQESFPDPQLREFLSANRSLQALLFTDSLGGAWQRFLSADSLVDPQQLQRRIRSALDRNPDLPARLQRYQKAGYRKIEPLIISASPASESPVVLLLFTLNIPARPGADKIAGFALEPQRFIREVLFPKLREIAGERFHLAVLHQGEQISFDPSESVDLSKLSEQKEIWLFPQFFLAIQPRGQTIEDLARERFFNNLLFILLLDLVLIGGVLFVYRNIRREMELAQLKADFVSNISHELRTPLALIRMFSETLDMGRVSSEARKREYYQIIGRETERLTHLVNNILNFSRIEAGRKQYHFEAVALNSVVHRVLDSYQFHLQNEGFALDTELTADLPAIRGDKDALAEALINLLDNGMKYSEVRKHLWVKTGSENGAVFVEVGDEGIGIAPEEQEKIFEKFHRVSSGLVHNTKGSGLGLTLVKHIVEAHDGKITLISKPGKGSRFRLWFREESRGE